MKKIVLVQDGQHGSPGAIDLACYLTRRTNARLTGLFPAYLNNDEQTVFARVIDDTAPNAVLFAEKTAATDAAVVRLKQACLERGVTCRIRRDGDDPERDIMRASLFADVLILDERLHFSEEDDAVPSPTVQRLLTGAGCPVILAPETFREAGDVMFAYDGTASSVFAIKQFSYLFPEMKDKTIVVVSVTDDGVVPARAALSEWLEGNFAHVVYQVMDGDPSARLLELPLTKGAAMLVLGAFGRNGISTLIRHSTAERMIRLAPMPVFIAHR